MMAAANPIGRAIRRFFASIYFALLLRLLRPAVTPRG